MEAGLLSLGPMAGVTDHAFRVLCREQGADLLYTEMVSAKGLHYRSRNTADLLKITPEEKPIGVQLFGSEPDIMAEAAENPLLKDFDFIDINMGCPVPKVVNNGEGSALLKDPDLARSIVKAVAEHSQGKPVTVKMRIGIDGCTIRPGEFAKYLEDGGASCIAVHGRTREQYYSGSADWNSIHEVKEAVTIPVIGNGDVDSPGSARRMLDETGCDGIMIARAAQGNPWIFAQIKAGIEKNVTIEKPDFQTVLSEIRRHADMLIAEKGEWTAVRELRKHVAWYTEGFPYSARLRNEVNLCVSMDEMLEKLDDFASRL
ncbi:MAG: tRNA dihydrouridine synthase DusB [Lachnospiraceae bacterium]|nr:tRNA dihydrouridine synthase DusB [Lachnospiraceae bacterium]